jgi:hypothetical protein
MLLRHDGYIVDLRPGVAVGPQSGIDDEGRVGATVHRGGDLRASTETREALAYIWLLGLTGRPQVSGPRSI